MQKRVAEAQQQLNERFKAELNRNQELHNQKVTELHAEMWKELKDAEETCRQQTAEAQQKADQTKEELHAQTTALQIKIAELESTLKDRDTQLHDIAADRDRYEQSFNECSASFQHEYNAVESLQQDAANNSAKYEEALRTSNSVTAQNQALHAELEQYHQAAQQLFAENLSLKNQNKLVMDLRNVAQDMLNTLIAETAELDGQRKKVEKLGEKVTELVDEIGRLHIKQINAETWRKRSSKTITNVIEQLKKLDDIDFKRDIGLDVIKERPDDATAPETEDHKAYDWMNKTVNAVSRVVEDYNANPTRNPGKATGCKDVGKEHRQHGVDPEQQRRPGR